MLERDVEAHLVKRVEELGGECRKVKWIGRVGAPDRLVMLPFARMETIRDGKLIPERPTCLWVELKAPGKAAGFPSNAHERAQVGHAADQAGDETDQQPQLQADHAQADAVD